MMKKIIFAFSIVLASTNVLAQDSNESSLNVDSILNKIYNLESLTKAVKKEGATKAQKENFDLFDIDRTFFKAKEILIITREESDSASLMFFEDINKNLNDYESAIYKDSLRNEISIKTNNFITTIKKLKKTIDNQEEILNRKNQEGEPSTDVIDEGTDTSKIETDSTKEEQSDSTKIILASIEDGKIILPKNTFNIMYITCIIILVLVIIIPILLYQLMGIRNSKKGNMPSGDNLLNEINQRLEQLQKKNTDQTLELQSNMQELSEHLNKVSDTLSKAENDLKKLEEKFSAYETKSDSPDAKLKSTETLKITQPQIIKYYGNLNQDGSAIYKASPEPREDLIYQINLKREADTEGELIIRENLSQEKMKQVLNDVATYLMSSACQIFSDSTNPSLIETVKSGIVQKEDGYNWKIVKQVQVKLV